MSNRYTKTAMLLGAVLFSPGTVVALPVATHTVQVETTQAAAPLGAPAQDLQGTTADQLAGTALRSRRA